MKIEKIRTVYSARRTKNSEFWARHPETVRGALPPEIGTIIRNGEAVFYSFIDGYDNPAIYGTADQLIEIINKGGR